MFFFIYHKDVNLPCNENTTILLPAARFAVEDPQAAWSDVRVAVQSLAAYNPDIEVVLAWAGSASPLNLPYHPHLRLVQQAEGIRTGSAAWNFCSDQTESEWIIILGDDCVVTPDMIDLMFEDAVGLLSDPGIKLGQVGVRSNYVKGPQNIRSANGSQLEGIKFGVENEVIEVGMVVPIACLMRLEDFRRFDGFYNANWFADDVLSWEMRNEGYRHFVSRGYCHHVGQRATAEERGSQDLYEQGLTWLRHSRPDFLEENLGISTELQVPSQRAADLPQDPLTKRAGSFKNIHRKAHKICVQTDWCNPEVLLTLLHSAVETAEMSSHSLTIDIAVDGEITNNDTYNRDLLMEEVIGSSKLGLTLVSSNDVDVQGYDLVLEDPGQGDVQITQYWTVMNQLMQIR